MAGAIRTTSGGGATITIASSHGGVNGNSRFHGFAGIFMHRPAGYLPDAGSRFSMAYPTSAGICKYRHGYTNKLPIAMIM